MRGVDWDVLLWARTGKSAVRWRVQRLLRKPGDGAVMAGGKDRGSGKATGVRLGVRLFSR